MSTETKTPAVVTVATLTSVKANFGGTMRALANIKDLRYGRKAADPAAASKLAYAMRQNGILNSVEESKASDGRVLTDNALALFTKISTQKNVNGESARKVLAIHTQTMNVSADIAAYKAAQSEAPAQD